jgi:hypothetical protein
MLPAKDFILTKESLELIACHISPVWDIDMTGLPPADAAVQVE